MSKVFGIFTDSCGEFSWRKIMTACSLIVFMSASFGYLIKTNFDELPASYQAIIAGVFGFYFMKSIFVLDKFKVNSNEQKGKK